VVAIGGLKTKVKSVRLLKTGQNVPFVQDEFSLRLTGLPQQAPDSPATVFEVDCEGDPVIDHDAIREHWLRHKVGIS
jgi:alpha-L-fucosidase